MNHVVILPTLRERENLVRLVPAIFTHAPEAHVVVVDDHSRDGTRELIEHLKNDHPNLHFLERTSNHGYGNAILAGLQWADQQKFSHVVTMDADFSHDPVELPAMLQKLNDHDVVIGSRYVTGGSIKNWAWYRRLLSWWANFYARAIIGHHLHDSTTGFVGYGPKAIRSLVQQPPHARGYAFLLECKNLLHCMGHTITEHPIVYTERREGQSKMSTKNIWEAIWLPWRLRFGRLKK